MFGRSGPRAPGEGTPQTISAGQAQQALLGQDPPWLLDVRTPAEYAAGHIPQAVLIPLAELPRRLPEVPRDRPIVCVCRSGHRSALATGFLRRQGLAVRNLAGGMHAWPGPVAAGRP